MKQARHIPLDIFVDTGVASVGRIAALAAFAIFFSVPAYSEQLGQRNGICHRISKLISKREIYNHMLERIPMTAGTDRYPNLDLDGDGINDTVTQSCSSGLQGEGCHLNINFSAAKNIEFRGGYFFLLRLEAAIFLLEGMGAGTQGEDIHRDRYVYRVLPNGINLACNAI